MEKDVATALRRIPLFEGVSEHTMTSERLGGLTNRNYRIDSPTGRYVLRLAGEGTAEYIGRMVLYKAMCDLLWTLWGVVQHASDNPAEDFWAYAVNRLERCKRLMASDAFPDHVAAVQRGPTATRSEIQI